MSNAIIQQIDSINERVVELYEQGKYSQVINLCRECSDLAKQHALTNHEIHRI